MYADNRLEEPTLFSAVLQPYRSLPPSGFTIVMLTIAALSALTSIMFLVMGAWPVTGFLGVDVLLVYWALRASYGTAKAYEQVIVTPSALMVRQVTHRGAVTEWQANPLWVRIDREELGEFGLQQLFLVSQGKRLPIGACLDPQARESFAAALSTALWEAKRGPTRTNIE
ncbi:MAG: DUF2244 domain-containing protein [Variibacter sp.]